MCSGMGRLGPILSGLSVPVHAKSGMVCERALPRFVQYSHASAGGVWKVLCFAHAALKQSWVQKTLLARGRPSSMHLGHCSLAGAPQLQASGSRRGGETLEEHLHSIEWLRMQQRCVSFKLMRLARVPQPPGTRRAKERSIMAQKLVRVRQGSCELSLSLDSYTCGVSGWQYRSSWQYHSSRAKQWRRWVMRGQRGCPGRCPAINEHAVPRQHTIIVTLPSPTCWKHSAFSGRGITGPKSAVAGAGEVCWPIALQHPCLSSLVQGRPMQAAALDEPMC